jgi:GNAT superfamily N-acetyltransferase
VSDQGVCRALNVADYEDTYTLYGALAAGGSLPDFDAGRAIFAQILEHPGTQIIGAADAGKIVSMATLHILPNMTYHMRPYALVENVATHPQRQGEGWGRLVMTAVADAAWAEDVYKIMLLTDQSRGTRAFYEKVGYTADKKHGMTLHHATAF